MVRICKKYLLVLSATFGIGTSLPAQPEWNHHWFFSVGANLMLHWGPGQAFPGMRLNASAGINAVYKSYTMLNYALTFSLYTKTVGANLNPLVNDIQFDVTNSLNVGGCWGDTLTYQKYFRTFNTGPYYNFITDRECAATIGTHLVLNNHRRNQMVGNLFVSTGSVTMNYYNDGGPPIQWLAVGDKFDRWWTGGFAVFVHNPKGYNTVEFVFDQFTGYKSQLYELVNILGIDVPIYDANEKKRNPTSPPDFNTSSYVLKYTLSPGFVVEAGAIGSLRNRHTGKAFGLQDIIHISMKHSLHPNKDINRFFIGGNYIYSGR